MIKILKASREKRGRDRKRRRFVLVIGDHSSIHMTKAEMVKVAKRMLWLASRSRERTISPNRTKR